MAFALVGSAGTAVQTTSGAALTTATFGTGETRTANNLLLFFVTVTGSATLPGTPSGGWAVGAQAAGTSCSATVFYKVAAGSDTAPTISAITSGLIAGHLEEWSGGASSNPIDEVGTASQTTQPIILTLSAANEATSNLVALAGADRRSVARASNDTWTSNHGTPTLRASNNGTSSTDHYSHATLISNSIAAADNATMTLSITTSITGLVSAGVSFRQIGTQNLTLGVITQTATIAAPTIDQTAPSTYATAIVADSPVAYYRMGEASGSVVDRIGTAHGTTTGTVTRDATGLITSAVGDDGAISFAASSYVSGTLGAAVGNVFTVEFWAKLPASGTATITPFSTKGAASNISMSVLRSGGTFSNFCFKGYIYDGASYDNVMASPDLVVAAGGTYHFVWTRAGTTAAQNKVYINGVDVTNISGATQAVVNTDTTFYIGGWEGTAETWTDTIDEVALYNTALSAATVLAHYNAGGGTQNLALGLISQTATISAPTVYSGYAAAVLADSPVSYWRLGEPSGTNAVDVMGANNGTYVNTPTLGVTGALSGDGDTAVTFNGTTQNITVASSTPFRASGTAAFTIEAWVKHTATGHFRQIASCLNATDGWELYHYDNGSSADLGFTRAPTTGSNIWATATQPGGRLDTNWHHLVGTYDGVNQRLYLDGRIVIGGQGEQVSPGSLPSDSTFKIGGDTIFWNGSIDEVAFYDTALSANRVAAHYIAGGGVLATRQVGQQRVHHQLLAH